MIRVISNQEYHASSPHSSSTLKKYLLSPTKFFQADSTGRKLDISGVKDFGAAYHYLIGEPHLFETEVVFQPVGVKVRNGKAWESFLSENADRTILTQDQKVKIEGMRAAWNLPVHSEAKELYNSVGPIELSFFGEIDGVDCKARPDKIVSGRRLLIDLKYSRDASSRSFSRDIHKFNYDLSAAMYLEVISAVTGLEHDSFVWIVQEAEPPYPIALYAASEKTLERGRQKMDTAIERLKLHLETGIQPFYPNEIIDI